MIPRNELITEDVISDVKQQLLDIFDSGIFDNPDKMRIAVEQLDRFTQNLAQLIWNTRDIMNSFQMIIPWYEQDAEPASKRMIQYTKKDCDITICVYPPSIEGWDKDGPEISPAHITDYWDDRLNRSIDNIFLFLKEDFTITEQLEILRVILRWYDIHFVSQEFPVDKSICESLEAFSCKVGQIVSKRQSQ